MFRLCEASRAEGGQRGPKGAEVGRGRVWGWAGVGVGGGDASARVGSLAAVTANHESYLNV